MTSTENVASQMSAGKLRQAIKPLIHVTYKTLFRSPSLPCPVSSFPRFILAPFHPCPISSLPHFILSASLLFRVSSFLHPFLTASLSNSVSSLQRLFLTASLPYSVSALLRYSFCDTFDMEFVNVVVVDWVGEAYCAMSVSSTLIANTVTAEKHSNAFVRKDGVAFTATKVCGFISASRFTFFIRQT